MTLVSDTHRFVFVHVPKTGGTSLRSALRPLCTDSYFERSVATKHLRASEVPLLHPDVPFADYFSFAFVRNPFDLLVSFWSYKMENPFHPDYVDVARLGSFERWVEQHIEQPGMAQHCFTHDGEGHQLVDFVGRYECLIRDVQIITERIGCEPLALPHANASQRHNRDRAIDRFSPGLRRRVEQAWHRDFEVFGYDEARPVLS